MICIKKNSCHSWNLNDTIGTLIFTGTIHDYAGNLVQSIEDPGGNITLPSDGIYYVTVEIGDVQDREVVIVTYKFVIFDFCDLLACVKKLLLEIWCKENICCDNCDEKAESKKRHEMNKIMAAFMSLIAVTYADSFTFYGLTCLTDAQMKKISEINMLYTNLTTLVQNCGACKETISYNTKPCKSC